MSLRTATLARGSPDCRERCAGTHCAGTRLRRQSAPPAHTRGCLVTQRRVVAGKCWCCNRDRSQDGPAENQCHAHAGTGAAARAWVTKLARIWSKIPARRSSYGSGPRSRTKRLAKRCCRSLTPARPRSLRDAAYCCLRLHAVGRRGVCDRALGLGRSMGCSQASRCSWLGGGDIGAPIPCMHSSGQHPPRLFRGASACLKSPARSFWNWGPARHASQHAHTCLEQIQSPARRTTP